MSGRVGPPGPMGSLMSGSPDDRATLDDLAAKTLFTLPEPLRIEQLVYDSGLVAVLEPLLHANGRVQTLVPGNSGRVQVCI